MNSSLLKSTNIGPGTVTTPSSPGTVTPTYPTPDGKPIPASPVTPTYPTPDGNPIPATPTPVIPSAVPSSTPQQVSMEQFSAALKQINPNITDAQLNQAYVAFHGGSVPASAASNPAPATPVASAPVTTTTDAANQTQDQNPSTGDPSLDALNAEKQQSLSSITDAYNGLQTQLASLSTGTLQLAPEEQQYITAMQASATSAATAAQEAANAQTGMTKYNLAKTGQTRSSPAVAAGQIALTVQAGVNAVQQINSQANLAIAQFEQGIRQNDIASARQAYTDFTAAQTDRMNALESMYTDVTNHEQDARDYAYKVQQDNISNQLNQENYGLAVAKLNEQISVDQGSGIGALSQGALDTLSRGYLTSGVLPALGNGKQAAAMKAAVVNNAVTLSGGNDAVNPALNHAQYTANSSVLKTQTANLTVAQTAYNIFDKNGQLALSLAQGLNKTNSPIVNQLTNNVINQTTGTGQLDSFRALVTSLQSEYATLINVKGGGTGVITDSDKSKAQAAIPDNISPTRLSQVLTTLKAEGQNVLTERQDTVSTLSDTIAKAGNTFNSQTAQTPIVGQVNIAKSAGYTSDEIVSSLLDNPAYAPQITQAQGQGYTSDDIINFLTSGGTTTANQ